MPLEAGSAFPNRIQEIGNDLRKRVGAEDVCVFNRLKNISRIGEVLGRGILLGAPFAGAAGAPFESLAAFLGLVGVSFHLSLEAQLNHSVMHRAYVGLPGAARLTPEKYETLAIPFQSKTWGDAHDVHHRNPSLLEDDPDTIHPLFRIHESQKWKIWHALNTFIGSIFVFECWAFDYDRFLKKTGRRALGDRGEVKKFALYLAYQLILFPLSSFAIFGGEFWKTVLAVNLLSIVVRNFVFIGLQTGSSVGHAVSTRHPLYKRKKSKFEWYRFQIETSKNFLVGPFWKFICGGLDRHIEHHLYPRLPPNRLYVASKEIRDLCSKNGVRYQEFASFGETARDSVSYLWKLSFRN